MVIWRSIQFKLSMTCYSYTYFSLAATKEVRLVACRPYYDDSLWAMAIIDLP